MIYTYTLVNKTSFYKSSGAYPPSGSIQQTNTVQPQRTLFGGLHTIEISLLRWVTNIDGDLRIYAANLVLPADFDKVVTDARSLCGEWVIWDGVNNTSWYVETAATTAFTTLLSGLAANGRIALSSLTNIPKNGYVSLRLTVSGGVASGKNLATISACSLEIIATSVTKPVIYSPVAGVYDRTQTITIRWTHNDAHGLPQGRFYLEYRSNAGAWSNVDQSNGNQYYTFAANTFALNAVVDIRVTTYSADDTTTPSLVSDILTFTAGAAVNVPTVTAPSGMITTSLITATWTSGESTRNAWRVVVTRVSDSVIIADSGIVAGSALSWDVVDGELNPIRLTDLTNYRIDIYVRSATNVWSAPGTATFNTVFDPPDAPTVVGAADNANGRNTLTITNPTGGDTPVYNRIRRKIDDGSYETIEEQWDIDTTYYDTRVPSRRLATYIVDAIGSNGGYASSTPVEITLNFTRGMWIQDFYDDDSLINLNILNNTARLQRKPQDVEYAYYEGRSRPVANESEGEQQTLELSFTLLDNDPKWSGSKSQKLTLEDLLNRRAIYYVRLLRGTALAGRIPSWTISESANYLYAWDVSITVYETET